MGIVLLAMLIASLSLSPSQINGKRILWKHLRDLYEAKCAVAKRSQGLFLLKKLSREHLELTSYSRMRVDLAAEVSFSFDIHSVIDCCIQVLSNSVAKGFEFYGDPETTETQRFCSMLDRFFDCLNGRNLSEHIKRRKPDLKPYYRSDDERLDVST